MTYMLRSQLIFPTSDYGEWGKQAKYILENERQLNEEGNYELTENGSEVFNEMLNERNNFLPEATDMKVSGPLSY